MSAASFVAELRRRNVLRAGLLYIGAIWAIAQGIAQLGPAFGAPDWLTRWFVIAAIIGFPFWIAFAWFYELTPQGLKRESEVAPDESIAHLTGRRLDFWIIGILAVAVVLLLTNTFVWRKGAGLNEGAHDIVAVLSKIPAKSIAVLPLIDESGDKDQQYFSDGLSEQLISDLTQINALKVIGKSSSFQFRDSKESTGTIAEKLGVANLLEGTVRRQGDRIRIVVSLIKAVDGSQLWSQTYDRELRDIFAVQSEIGHAVASALQIRLLSKPIVSEEQPASGNVAAYRIMLQSRDIARHGTEAALRQGIGLLGSAIQQDPGYAYAYGALSNDWMNLGRLYLTGEERQHAYAQARDAAAVELSLAPDTASAHVDRGYVLAGLDRDQQGALIEFDRARALAPNDGNTMAFLAGQLSNLGQLQPAVDLYRRALDTDPLRADWYSNLANLLVAQGRLDEADRALHEALALQPDFPGLYQWLALTATLRGDAPAALRNAEKETDPDLKAWSLAMAAQIAGDSKQADASLRAYVAKYGSSQPYLIAELYALRGQPDDMFQWLDRALDLQDASIVFLLYDPFFPRYQHDPRFAALCRKIGLPAPGAASADATAASNGAGH
ncbi:MAG: tetratricopeptide repeat protein [Rhodanobacteraceae bacterium]